MTVTHATPVELVIPGPPKGKGRPRFNSQTGRTYTPDGTVSAQERVREAWRDAGSPVMFDTPVGMVVEVVIRRPQSHLRVNGTLSKAGIEAPWPMRVPDLDNVLKLIGDALNNHCFRDDRQIVQAAASRRWARPLEDDHVRVSIWPIVTEVAA